MRRVVIMGAAGRDFHNFNVVFKNDPQTEVVAFTATQIPFIADRRYPPELAGARYPDGIPIYPEDDLPPLIRGTARRHGGVRLLGRLPRVRDASGQRGPGGGGGLRVARSGRTMIPTTVPVIAICAVRTGGGEESDDPSDRADPPR